MQNDEIKITAEMVDFPATLHRMRLMKRSAVAREIGENTGTVLSVLNRNYTQTGTKQERILGKLYDMGLVVLKPVEGKEAA